MVTTRRRREVLSFLTAPVIYSLLLPFAILDLWVMLYQAVCFPVYGIAPVRRRRFLALDRHKLAYLSGIEKVNCTFCSYATGVLAYVREVSACTEQYWCPIKHARAIPTPHERYRVFVDYGDAHGYRRELPALRRRLEAPSEPPRGRRVPHTTARRRHRVSGAVCRARHTYHANGTSPPATWGRTSWPRPNRPEASVRERQRHRRGDSPQQRAFLRPSQLGCVLGVAPLGRAPEPRPARRSPRV